MLHSSVRSRGRGFTLVELLVVVGIIALLIGVLLPVLNKAKERANALKCQANLRTLMQAFQMFAQDNKESLPGNDNDRDDPNYLHRDFLCGPPQNKVLPTPNFSVAPEWGTIYKYVKNRNVYFCPSQVGAGAVGAGGGSNERFDYAFFKSLTGAKVHKVKSTSRFINPKTGKITTGIPTPVIVQELAKFIDGSNIEGGHSNRDAMETIHNGGSYYAAIDGSVQYFQEPKIDYNNDSLGLANHWESIAPSGKWTSIGRAGTTWGWWNVQ